MILGKEEYRVFIKKRKKKNIELKIKMNLGKEEKYATRIR